MPSSSAITGFGFPKHELNADFRLRRRGAAFPQHASRKGDRVFVEFDRHRYETALRVPGGVLGKRARWHEPFRFERENAISGRNPHARRHVGRSVRGTGDLPEKLQNRCGQLVADRHVARVIARLSRENSEQMFEAGGLVDEPRVSSRDQLTASHRRSCRADWSLIPLVRISGGSPPKCLREPWTQPVETLNIVHRKGARAAWTGKVNISNCRAAIADHRVQVPSRNRAAPLFPGKATFEVTAPLPMQRPTDARPRGTAGTQTVKSGPLDHP